MEMSRTFGVVGVALALVMVTRGCGDGPSDSLPTGSPCVGGSECLGEVCLFDWAGWPSGMCTEPCAGECPEGQACAPAAGAAYCLPVCGGGAPCRPDYVCNPDLGVCLPDCRVAGCGAGFECDAGSGVCGVGAMAAAPLGDPCTGPLDCASGLCLAESGIDGSTGWTGGACTEPCSGGECPSGATCVGLSGQALCLPACGDSAACREGYVCSTLGVCLPDCHNGFSCGAGYSCGGDGLCAPSPTLRGGVGDPCGGDLDCVSGICALSTGWTDGMCVGVCGSDACGAGTGCVVLDGVSWCLPSCASDASCRDGYVCSDEQCLPDCRLGWGCGGGFACGDDGACRPDASDLKTIGAPCAADAGCQSGLCLEQTGAAGIVAWIEGMCARICKSSACGGDTGCVVLDGVSFCLPSCGGQSPCRDGYVCSDDLHVCLPDCRLGWDCGQSFVCSDDGQCRADVLSLGADGAPCQSHAECQSGACLLLPPEAPSSWNDGICVRPCGGGCPANFKCLPFGPVAYCMSSCASSADCPASYVCHPMQQACTPSCKAGWLCPPGVSCSPGGVCQGGPGGP